MITKNDIAGSGSRVASCRLFLGMLLAIGLGLFAATPNDKKAPTNAPVKATNAAVVAPVEAPRAVFVPGGRDPFFPESRRNQDVKPVTVTTTTPGVVTPPRPSVKRNPADYLRITGLLYSRTRPLVTINNVDFRPDGKAEVVMMVPDDRDVPQPQTNVVHCLEIGRKSAKIEIVGVPGTKELFWTE